MEELISTEVADLYQDLFNLLYKEHGLTCTISEMNDIIEASKKILNQ